MALVGVTKEPLIRSRIDDVLEDVCDPNQTLMTAALTVWTLVIGVSASVLGM